MYAYQTKLKNYIYIWFDMSSIQYILFDNLFLQNYQKSLLYSVRSHIINDCY